MLLQKIFRFLLNNLEAAGLMLKLLPEDRNRDTYGSSKQTLVSLVSRAP